MGLSRLTRFLRMSKMSCFRGRHPDDRGGSKTFGGKNAYVIDYIKTISFVFNTSSPKDAVLKPLVEGLEAGIAWNEGVSRPAPRVIQDPSAKLTADVSTGRTVSRGMANAATGFFSPRKQRGRFALLEDIARTGYVTQSWPRAPCGCKRTE